MSDRTLLAVPAAWNCSSACRQPDPGETAPQSMPPTVVPCWAATWERQLLKTPRVALWDGSALISTEGASPAEEPSTFALAQTELTPWCASKRSGRGLGMSPYRPTTLLASAAAPWAT